LIVFLFEAKTRQLLWRGSTTRNFIPERPPAELVVKAVREAVKDLPK
jgi:hypothetical protein